MGQRCCRPAIRLDPKHTQLIALIYSETQQNVKKLDYDEINEFLMKKGHVKVLGDYLSSHLNLIGASIACCNNRHIAARNKDPYTIIFINCITS